MKDHNISFDLQAALDALRQGKDLNGEDGILTPLIKQLTEAAMQAELEQHLADDKTSNRENGSTPSILSSGWVFPPKKRGIHKWNFPVT